MPLFRLGQLGFHELGLGAEHQLTLEALAEIVGERGHAPKIPGLQQRGPDRHIAPRLAQALVHRPGCMPNLKTQIPEHVEHELNDLLTAGGLLVGPQEQEIDVGMRGQLPPPVAADGEDGHLLPSVGFDVR